MAAVAVLPVGYHGLGVPRDVSLQTLKIESNDGSIIPERYLGWLEPVSKDTPAEEMQRRFERDGVLLVKGVIDPEKVRDCRGKYFSYMASTGVLKEGTNPRDGIFCGHDHHEFAGVGAAGYLGRSAADCEYFAKSISCHAENWVNDFAHDDDLLATIKQIKPNWDDAQVFRRQLLRSSIPNTFVRAGPPTFVTAWIPLGDVPPESGGLIYLEDSVPVAQKIEDQFLLENQSLSKDEQLSAFNVNMTDRGAISRACGQFSQEHGGRKWLVANYQAGDVVFHHPFMIHASGACYDKQDRIRLSMDVRFADVSKPHDERWNKSYFKLGDGL